MCYNNTIIDGVRLENTELLFKKPYYLDYKVEDGVYTHYNEALDLFSYGSNLEELKECFHEDIVTAWRLYVDCDIKELSTDARRVREELKEILLKTA